MDKTSMMRYAHKKKQGFIGNPCFFFLLSCRNNVVFRYHNAIKGLFSHNPQVNKIIAAHI
jgi:hypothetical protein